ncbi:ATP-dependent DNA ligase [Candidatus Microgenomates bacterium]|nr:ATP-dependent DNA ligase [Candidatus Microgenomates bacterium]
MLFRRLAEYFQQLESTTLRNKLTEILADLFKEAGKGEIGKLCYLLQGRVAPLYEAIEFGMGEKMVIRAIASGTGLETEAVLKIFKNKGDLGETVEEIKSAKSLPCRQAGVKRKAERKINIKEVYEILYKMAEAGGEGSQDGKIQYLGNLIKEVDPLSAKYIIKIAIAKLRLGFSDMTILDSLSWMIDGTKASRSQIEKAYNVRPDLGDISEVIKEKGIRGLGNITPEVGTPILMARAERMTSGRDIIEKIGKCAIEPKYDGFRVQVHFSKSKFNPPAGGPIYKKKDENLHLFKEDERFIRLFSRNLEDVTKMYPDIVEGAKKQIKAKEAILEGEAIAYNPKTGVYLPFQETVQRKRKYNISEKAKEVPLRLFAFDILYLDGQNLLPLSYVKRREILENTIGKGETILIAREEIVSTPKELEEIFEESVKQGLEGVMAKKLEGVYRAGARDFNWIKYKKSYASKLADTIDAVVMGYDLGQGKRTGFGIGGFLIGLYDPKKEKFVTVSKIGTGLTDEEWKQLKLRTKNQKLRTKPKNYEVDNMMECDVWVEPKIVVEIRADEITRSPVHTAGRVMKPSKSGSAYDVEVPGFALRFPRLERFRGDKKPQDATTVSEIQRMYGMQYG